jgi:adenylate cyclase
LQTLYGFFIESRGRRQLSRLFSQYVPPELVAEMDARPQRYSMESDSRELTVLFSDVRGFTRISETLPPRDLSRLMNDFLTPMTRVIHAHRGTIDKYMGDAIMAFWGAPVPDPEHARHALDAALEMQATLKQLNPEFRRRAWPELQIGIGLNTGPMRVGDMGSEFRRAYTVMGDAVNLGERFQRLTRVYAVDIVCGEALRAAVPEFIFLELDRVRVRGKDRAVAIYQPLGVRDVLAPGLNSLLARHQQALGAYRAADWDRAEAAFFALSQSRPDWFLYRLYLDRVTYFRKHPPQQGWDGVFSFDAE